MTLKTIEEHNKEILRLSATKMLTGIECPVCKEEMQFTDNTVMLSNPPQKDIKCFNCNYTSRIYV